MPNVKPHIRRGSAPKLNNLSDLEFSILAGYFRRFFGDVSLAIALITSVL